MSDRLVVECSSCGKTLRVQASEQERRGKCPACGAGITVPAAARHPEEWPASAEEEHPRGASGMRPWPLNAAALLLMLLGGVTLPMALVSRAGILVSQRYPMPDFGPLALLLMVPVGGALFLGGLGLVLRRSWAWGLSLMGLLCGTVYYGKLVMTVLLALNWDHPAASGIAGGVLLFQGVPLLLFLLIVALLAMPSLRSWLAGGRSGRRVRSGKARRARTGA